MPQTRSEVVKFVRHKVGADSLTQMTDYFKEHADDHGNLWGSEKPPKFVSDMVLLAFLKDLKGVGYRALIEQISFGYKITHLSLEHNIQLVRQTLADWADSVIQLGNLADLKHDSARAGLKPRVKNANIWMDSSDFRTQGKRSMSRKDRWWSYKENSPARRH